MSQQIEQELAALRAEVAKLAERMPSIVLPKLFKVPLAAKHLGVSLTKMKDLIRIGDVRTVELGGRRMVPLSELERLCTLPDRPMPRAKSRRTAKERASALRERLRRER